MEYCNIVLAADGGGQDRLQVLRRGEQLIVAIADGAGGRSGGAEAAELAVELIAKGAHELETQADCEELLRKADTAISTNANCGETTAVVAVASETGIYGASVGDSGVWILNGTSIDELTKFQQRKPFLGNGGLAVGFRREEWGGTLLVATDGLLKYTSWEAIASIAAQQDLRELPAALVGLVRYPSGNLPDDIAIAVCRST